MFDQHGFMTAFYTGDRGDVNVTYFLLTLVYQTTRYVYTDHVIVIRVTSPKFSPLCVTKPLVNRRILMFDVCVTLHHQYIDVNNQQDANSFFVY